MVDGSHVFHQSPAVLYDSLSITVARFGEGSPLQMIFITLVYVCNCSSGMQLPQLVLRLWDSVPPMYGQSSHE